MNDGDSDRENRTTLSVTEFAERYDATAETYDEKYDIDDDEHQEYGRIVSLIVEYADPSAGDTVVDLGTGTGIVALELAEDAAHVLGRDVSEGMLERARANATERGIENASFGVGSFREPTVDAADIVVTNLAIHHLDNEEKREAIETIATLEPRRVVIGAAMFFDERDPADPEYDPEIVYPATVGNMLHWLTEAGFAITAVEKVTDVLGVLAAERIDRTKQSSLQYC